MKIEVVNNGIRLTTQSTDDQFTLGKIVANLKLQSWAIGGGQRCTDVTSDELVKKLAETK